MNGKNFVGYLTENVHLHSFRFIYYFIFYWAILTCRLIRLLFSGREYAEKIIMYSWDDDMKERNKRTGFMSRMFGGWFSSIAFFGLISMITNSYIGIIPFFIFVGISYLYDIAQDYYVWKYNLQDSEGSEPQ